MKVLFVCTLAVLAAIYSFAHADPTSHTDPTAVCDFPVPKNIRITEFAGSGLTFAQYTAVMDRVERTYAPIFRRLGTKFEIVRSWSDSTVNAQAWCSGSSRTNCAGGTCHIEMFGGFARYPGMSSNSMALVAGHEIGHCLGGAPFYPASLLSAEGQADFYSTATALPRMGLASKNAARIISDIFSNFEGRGPTSLPGPPLRKVTNTVYSHPAAQCRRVTYEAGRVHGSRPGCWFAALPVVDNPVDFVDNYVPL